MRLFTYIPLVAVLCGAAFGQSAKPAFQIADVHISAPSRNQNMQGGVLQAGRYEIRRATMLDLIKTAYGVDADTVFGGPSWLEWDRYDVVAKAPAGTSAATVRLMLQALLADRFKLAVHKDTKPIQGFVLSMGKGKHKLKTADGSGESGCVRQPPPPPNPDFIPPGVIFCRGVTMEEFAPLLRALGGGYLNGPVLDSTGLKGAWDFDIKVTDQIAIQLNLAGADGMTVFDAVDRQLGLKLEPGKVPMPALVVDSANEKPSANPPEVKTALPPPPSPEFEVASVRANPPGTQLGPPGGLQPGGRYEMHAFPMWVMIRQAWDVNTQPGEEIPGTPKWLDMYNPLIDIVAKVPATSFSGPQLFNEDLQLMLRALLVDRFKMKAHYEDRPMDAYTLVAAKPKMKPADPANRTGCKFAPAAPIDLTAGPPPRVATCQNITMAQFAERLQTIAPTYLHYPVLDASGIQGAWDFTLTFSGVDPNRAGGGGGRNGTKGGGPAPAAGVLSDPIGGVSLFDAVDKQLGLKLEKHQRPEPVFVIDHIEENPTDN
jgi:uncharacterized protein (TIGR03435 family)